MSGPVETNSSRRSGSIGTAASGPTVSSSDPAIDTNPSGGVGTQWANSSTGDFYVCTDATAGENVWTNVDAGQSSIQPFVYQGANFGYCAGGGAPAVDVIEKYSFTSDGNGTDVANLPSAQSGLSECGCVSATYGYLMSNWPNGAAMYKNDFASDGDSTSVGDATISKSDCSGSSSTTHGYWAGGYAGSAPGTDVVDKFALSTTADATDVGNLTQARTGTGGGTDQSGGYGYAAGGGTGNMTRYDRIDRHSFSSDGDSTDVGNMLANSYREGGSSSSTHGYTTGGNYPYVNPIEKYSFASSANSTDVGNISGSYGSTTGTSATSYGYWAGGGPPNLNNIEKYSYSSDGDSTDVGDLTAARRDCGAYHY